MVANPGPTAAALIARGVPAADPRLTPLVQIATLLACTPPSSNILFDGRNTVQEREDKEWTGTAKLAYRFNPGVMTYASAARGYKGGGFNLDRTQSSNGLPTGSNGVVPITDTSFPAEYVDSYELGAKTTWLAGTLLLNATLFHQTYENFQLNTFLGTSFVVESIPEVVSKGVDADMVWFTPVDGLMVQAGLTYADTTISQFSRTDLPSKPDAARFAPLVLLPGNTLGFAPEFSLTGSLNYEREIGGNLRGVFNLSGKYVTEYNTGSDLSPFKVQDSFGLLNGRVGIGSADERWTLELWGQNLTDAEYYQVVFNGPLQGSFVPTLRTVYEQQADTVTYDAFLGQPRTYGLTLRVKY
jgi:outer membrane receptor protein involved in Fe transport